MFSRPPSIISLRPLPPSHFIQSPSISTITVRYRGTSPPTGRSIPVNSKTGKPGGKGKPPQRGGGDAKRNARARTVPQSKKGDMGRKGREEESVAVKVEEGKAYGDLDDSFFDLDVPLKEVGKGAGAEKNQVPRPAKSGAPRTGGKKPVRLTREQQARAERSKAGSGGGKPLMNKGLVQMLSKKSVTEVRLVVETYAMDEKNESRVCSLEEAVAVARDELDIDLVLVTPADKLSSASQVVVKAVDWGRMEYDKKKKEKVAKKASIDAGKKPTKTKEIKFGAAVETGDFDRKIAQLIKHLEKGHSVKVTIMAKKREMNLNPTCVKELQISVFKKLEKYVTKDSSRKLPGFAQFRYQVVFTPKGNIAEILSKEETLKRIAREEGLSEDLVKSKINL
ncbi:hypothetical protein TL16_g01496 [Triparma laevis f. inornata]|uniref:Translation initiation factor 3 C-terminal domain-containing protein n=1 Tax=Triparma laevis f. inornata TaxID=1714386 RepID=A0A9W6ZKC1_9STRA|nr:hypothetical protein TL16_g01496 [Triparma laevis f. inornata]